jgi:hypothetical protein
MYDGMRATDASAALYFLFVVIVGNYVVLNLFLAILLEQFSSGDADEEQSKLQDAASTAADEQSTIGCQCTSVDAMEVKRSESSFQKFRPLHESITGRASRDIRTNSISRRVSRIFLPDDVDWSTISSMLEGHSLYIFGPRHPVRIFLARIVWHKRFEQLIITLIMLSSIVLAIDAPTLDPSSRLKATLVRPLTSKLCFVTIISCLLCMLHAGPQVVSLTRA